MKKLLWIPILTLLMVACARNDMVQIRGKLSVKGDNAYLTVKDGKSHKVYEITNPKDFNLYGKRQQIVTLGVVPPKEAAASRSPIEVQMVGFE